MRKELLGYRYDQYTFGQMLADKAERNGDKMYLHCLITGRKFSYREIHELSSRIANSLLGRGIGKGAHVAMLMENSAEQLLTYFALGKIGAVAVPINIAARGPFLHYYLNQSDSTSLFIDAELLEHFLSLPERAPIRNVFVLPQHGEDIELPEDHCAQLTEFSALLAGAAQAPEVQVHYSDPCAIMYTSGTTGPSKGNLHTQASILAFGLGQVAPLRYNADDIYHVCMPLFHAGAYAGAAVVMLVVDGGVALSRRLSVSNFWQEIRESNATRSMLLSVSGFLFNQPKSDRDREHRLRTAVATPVPVFASEFEERFGVCLFQGYGLSDFGVCTSQAPDGPADKRASIGRPLEDWSVRIVDDDDIDMPVGQVGEIILRYDGLPAAAAQGYYKMPDVSMATRRNLWFHTGDRGWIDSDGYVYFADRKKDAIRRRGENISAYEVEQAIARHPAVADVAAFPVSNGSGDEDVGVTLVLKDGAQLTEVALIEHCAGNMPYYMVPRFVEFRSEMPRTMTQKIIKHILQSNAEENPASLWDREKAGIKLARK